MAQIPCYSKPGMMIDRKGAMFEFCDSKYGFTKKRKGIEEWAKKGRYGSRPDYVVKTDGSKVLINYYAYLDYMMHGEALENKNTAKQVPPFDAAAIAQITPRHMVYVTED